MYKKGCLKVSSFGIQIYTLLQLKVSKPGIAGMGCIFLCTVSKHCSSEVLPLAWVHLTIVIKRVTKISQGFKAPSLYTASRLPQLSLPLPLSSKILTEPVAESFHENCKQEK